MWGKVSITLIHGSDTKGSAPYPGEGAIAVKKGATLKGFSPLCGGRCNDSFIRALKVKVQPPMRGKVWLWEMPIESWRGSAPYAGEGAVAALMFVYFQRFSPLCGGR